MGKTLDWIRKQSKLWLTFFYIGDCTSVELGKCVVSKRYEEVGSAKSVSRLSLPFYVLERIPADTLSEMEEKGLLKDGKYSVNDFIEEYNLNIRQSKIEQAHGFGMQYFVEYVDMAGEAEK